jgi:hypothetical protein
VKNNGWEGRCVVWIVNLELQGGSPRLSRLRTNHLALVSKFDYVLAHTGFMGSCELSSVVCHRVGQYLSSLNGCYMGKCSSHPRIAYRGSHMEDDTRVR